MTGFKDQYDPEFVDDEVYEYDSGDDVYEENIESFIAKEVEKMKAKGTSTYYKKKKYQCPYCTRRKPTDGIFEHLISHAWDASRSSNDYTIRGNMLPF
ncbi:lrr receptor-like serine threonine-protein kinase [Hordeum vulgare]|nr:lrr receptor-like serine threonine-protein kinase [Hordeum vulgare]